MTTKKVFLFLPADNIYARAFRRAAVIGVITMFVVALKTLLPQFPEWTVPVATALLAAADKFIRDLAS